MGEQRLQWACVTDRGSAVNFFDWGLSEASDRTGLRLDCIGLFVASHQAWDGLVLAMG